MKAIESIASQHLGKTSQYTSEYNPQLLVAIPRQLNREGLGISTPLSFVGYDIWHGYEVSFLTDKGLPVNGVIKLVLNADSETHVESKSLKLYLNSFNMTKLGANSQQAIQYFETLVTTDLSELIGSPVQVYFHQHLNAIDAFIAYEPIEKIIDLEMIDFSHDAKLITTNSPSTLAFSTNLLRSNCRVTNQPDWGDIYVYYEADVTLDLESFARFVVAMRSMNHFHEEICEYIYAELLRILEPQQLMVCCLYTRRGGIDINPIRATHSSLIPAILTSAEIFQLKTMRQ